MKIAVIGASGFIGGYLVKELKKNKKIQIIATFNKSKKKGVTKNLKWKKIDIKKVRGNMFYYLEKPDIVINAAWRDIPNYDSQTNIKTLSFQKKLVKNLILHGLKNLVILGTCFEYGLKNGKLNEKSQTLPITKYGKAKLNLLNFCLNLRNKYSYNLSWLRLFYMYGHNPNRDTLFNLIQKFKKNKLSSLAISGNLKRDYMPIKKVVWTIKKLSLMSKNFGIVNVCSGYPTSLKNITRKIINSKNKFSKINFNVKNKNHYEAVKFWGCNKKLNKILKRCNH